jgi:hypothetical protein
LRYRREQIMALAQRRRASGDNIPSSRLTRAAAASRTRSHMVTVYRVLISLKLRQCDGVTAEFRDNLQKARTGKHSRNGPTAPPTGLSVIPATSQFATLLFPAIPLAPPLLFA